MSEPMCHSEVSKSGRGRGGEAEVKTVNRDNITPSSLYFLCCGWHATESYRLLSRRDILSTCGSARRGSGSKKNEETKGGRVQWL